MRRVVEVPKPGRLLLAAEVRVQLGDKPLALEGLDMAVAERQIGPLVSR
jgi:hypothetical protein